MASIISGEIIAENVDVETFLREYMGQHVELIDGIVIKMSPVTRKHDDITAFLRTLFSLYLSRTNEGKVHGDPFAFRLKPDSNVRQPDLIVVLNENLDKLKETVMEGAPDLIVEVVSKESTERDRGEKFHLYEETKVREYWIIDPLHQETLFYTLAQTGFFIARPVDQQGIYKSYVLPQFHLKASLLLEPQIPDAWAAVQLVNDMLKD